MIEETIHSFKSSIEFIKQSVADLSDQQMVQQPIELPNHGTWTLGHIINSCQGITGELGIETWLPDNWESLFGYGSIPSSDITRYPNKTEMVLMLTEAANRLCQALLAMDESYLQQPLKDEQGRKLFPSVGHALLQVVVAIPPFTQGN